MKNVIYVLFSLLTTGCLMTSCKEDVDLIGDFEETAVIYGLLDQSDSIHYIKINRAFIGPGNSLEIAQIPDSNYFDQVDATITEYGFKADGVTPTVRVWTLMDTIIENKETNGVFYAPFQKVYYFVTRKCESDGDQFFNTANNYDDPLNSLNREATYKLHVSINGGEFEVDGETELVSGISSTSSGQTFSFKFAEGNPVTYTQNGLSVNVGTSHIVNATLEVFYNEYTDAVTSTRNSFEWNLGEAETTPGDSKSFTMSGQQFYNLMADDATDSPSIMKRNMHSIKVKITGGSEDLNTYITVNQPSSTLAQNKPTFTNLTVTEGHNVIGLFSSRFTLTIEKLYINPFNPNPNIRTISAESVRELCIGAITGDLLFCSQHPGDNSTSYDCP